MMLLTAVVGLWCAAFGITLAALLDHWATMIRGEPINVRGGGTDG